MMLSTSAAKANFAPSVAKSSRSQRARSQVVVRASAEQPKEMATKVASLMAAAALVFGAPAAHAVDFTDNRAKFVKEATNRGGGAIDDALSRGGDAAQTARNVASQGLKGVGKDIGENLGNQQGGVNQRLAAKARANYGVFNQDTRSAQPGSGNRFRGEGNTSSVGAGSINPTEAARSVGDTVDSVKGKVKQAGSAVRGVSGAASGVRGAANEAANKASGVGASVKGALNLDVGDKAGDAVDAVKGAANKAAGAGGDIVDSAKGIFGRN